MFAFDAFSSDDALLMQIAHFLVNLTPSFILLAFLIIAWKRELIGGIIFSITGMGIAPFIYLRNSSHSYSVTTNLGTTLSIALPILVVGILFIASYFKKRKSAKELYQN
jgi:hypothetical protein